MILLFTNKKEEYQKIIEYIKTEKSEILEIINDIEQDDINTIAPIVKNSNHYTKIIIDINSFNNAEDEIIKAIKSFKMTYLGSFIILALGQKKSELINKIYDIDVINFITSVDDKSIISELDECLIGCTKEQAIKHTLLCDDNIKEVIGDGKQVKIGVIGAMPRVGTTTISVNLLKYISEHSKSCLIEMNKNNHLYYLGNSISKDIDKTNGKIDYRSLEIYYYKEIRSTNFNDYSYIIYDFGSDINNLSEFLECDIKIVVTGTKIWELGYFNDVLQKTYNDNNVYYILNFSNKNDETLKEIINNMLDYRVNKGHYINFISDYLHSVDETSELVYKNILGFSDEIKQEIEKTTKSKGFKLFKK